MSKTKVSLRIPNDLLERTTVVAEITRKSRGEIVSDALRDHLAELETQAAFKEDVFDLYLNGQISLETLDRVLDSEDPESAHITKTLFDRGNGPDDDSASEV
jgi:predicted DNA-binding protein